MYSKVNTLPVTGSGTMASGGAALAYGGVWLWIFAILASFAIIGAVGAMLRTLPATSFMLRMPKQLAPKHRPQPRQKKRRW